MNELHTEQENKGNNIIPSVAVVILNWNGRSFLEKFLPSVVNSSYNNIQIIVADNDSDDSIIFLNQHYPSIKIIQNGENGGFAKGYNMALKQVNSDYFVLLNSDVEVTPNWIESVIELMEGNKEIAACQPKILDQKRKSHFEYAGACGGFIDKYGYPFSRGRIFDDVEEDKGQYNDITSCFWATGACMFVRSKVFNDLSGFDEYFFAHQEEIDLCWRMQLNGFKIYVQPASVVYHVGGGTLPKGNSKKVYLNFRNNLIMLYKNLTVLNKLKVIPIRLILDGIAAIKALLSGDAGYFVAIFKAHFGFYNWLLFYQKKINQNKTNMDKIIGVYNKSIVWSYFIKKKKKFSEIIFNN